MRFGLKNIIDFQVYQSFSNYIEAVDNDINNKLESMYKELNDKYNNIVSVFNEIVDKVAWWIPFKKFRDNFRNKFRIVI